MTGLAVWFLRGAAALGLLVPDPLLAAQPADAAPRLLWHLAEPARGIPASDGVSVYFMSNRHELLAASVTNGRVRWRVPMDSTGETFGSRVLVRHDIVVAGDYNLMGVNRRTGRRVWSFVPLDGGGAGVHLGESAGDLVLTGSLTGALRAVSITTGRLRWSVEVGDPSVTTVYAPVVQGGLAAAAFTDFGPVPAGGVVVVDMPSGRVRWRRHVPGSVGASGNPVFAGDAVAVAARDGRIHAFDATSGRALWVLPSVEQMAGQQDYRPLAVTGRTLVAGSLSGQVVAHDLDSRRVLWRHAPVLASVAFAIAARAGIVYVPYFSNQIVAFRARDGAELWRLGGGASDFRWVPRVDGPLLAISGGRSLSLFRQPLTGVFGRP